MQLCKFSLFVYLLFYQVSSYGLFQGNDCLKSQFNIQVSHKGPPLGFLLNKLKIKKTKCVLIVEKEKLRLLRSKWEFDVCRYPIHIKVGTGAVKVHKKLRKSCDFTTENKDSFCNSLKSLKNAISDYGLIFAQGEKENLLSDHGKVYCAFLLINHYFDEEKIFSFADEKKTSLYFEKITGKKNEIDLKGSKQGNQKENQKSTEDLKSAKLKGEEKVTEQKNHDSSVDNLDPDNIENDKEDLGVF